MAVHPECKAPEIAAKLGRTGKHVCKDGCSAIIVKNGKDVTIIGECIEDSQQSQSPISDEIAKRDSWMIHGHSDETPE